MFSRLVNQAKNTSQTGNTLYFLILCSQCCNHLISYRHITRHRTAQTNQRQKEKHNHSQARQKLQPVLNFNCNKKLAKKRMQNQLITQKSSEKRIATIANCKNATHHGLKLQKGLKTDNYYCMDGIPTLNVSYCIVKKI